MQTQMQATKPTKPSTSSKKTIESTPTPITTTTTETTEKTPVTTPSTAITTTVTETEQRAIEAALSDTIATQTVPTPPNPRDLVGADVFYVLPHTGQRRPATITFDYETEGQLVDITVFTRGKLDGYPEPTPGYDGILVVHSVAYAPATTKETGTWHWRTEKA